MTVFYTMHIFLKPLVDAHAVFDVVVDDLCSL